MNIEQLIRGNEKLIYKVANMFYNADKEDLYQAGALGIIKAYRNYQNNGNVKFSSYAFDYIYGEMYKLVNNRPVKISKDILKLFRMIEKVRSTLTQKNGKVPSNKEIAEFLEMPLSDIEMAVMAGCEIMSLDNENAMSYYESLKAEERSSVDDQILISQSLEMLSPSEQEIIKARYYEDMTQSEVAKKFDMTQVMVSRYEKKGLSKMQDFMRL